MNCSRLARRIETTEKNLRRADRRNLHVPRRDELVHDLKQMTVNLDYLSWVATNQPIQGEEIFG